MVKTWAHNSVETLGLFVCNVLHGSFDDTLVDALTKQSVGLNRIFLIKGHSLNCKLTSSLQCPHISRVNLLAQSLDGFRSGHPHIAVILFCISCLYIGLKPIV